MKQYVDKYLEEMDELHNNKMVDDVLEKLGMSYTQYTIISGIQVLKKISEKLDTESSPNGISSSDLLTYIDFFSYLNKRIQNEPINNNEKQNFRFTVYNIVSDAVINIPSTESDRSSFCKMMIYQALYNEFKDIPQIEQKVSEALNRFKAHSTSKKSPKNKIKIGSLIGIVISIAVLVLILNTMNKGGDIPQKTTTVPEVHTTLVTTTNTKSQTSMMTTTSLKPVIISNGYIKTSLSGDCIAPVSIHAPKDSNCYVYFKSCIYDAPFDFSVYIQKGTTFEFDAPLGTFELYYATGETWYGTKHRFGNDSRFFKAEDSLFRFYQDADYVYGTELTLYTIPNGNMDTKEISEREFPG